MYASIRAAVCALIVSFAGSLNAATISVDDSSSGFALITIQGDLVLDDFEQFRQKVATIPKAVVMFQSDGGNLQAGIQIGKIIRTRNYSTFVPDEIRCASACALAWLGGTSRYMGAKALVGFHAAHNAITGRESVPNALVGSYLSQIGLSDAAIMYITEPPPTSMKYLTIGDAKEVGIDVSLIDLEKTSLSSSPPPARPAPKTSMRLRERALQFVDLLYSATSGATEARSLNTFYADKVIYFRSGEISREQVLSEIQKHFARWPVRKYRPKDGSVAIDCDEGKLACAVEGIVVYDAQSPERNQHSAGKATFKYFISFAPPNELAPRIVVEGGDLISRDVAALNSGGWLSDFLSQLKGRKSYSQGASDRHAPR